MFGEAKDDGSGGDNWSYIGRAKLQSNNHQRTNIQFLRTGCPSCCPTNSVKALKGKYHIPLTCLPQTRGLPTLSLTTNSFWLHWGRVAMPLISPLMPVPCKYNYYQYLLKNPDLVAPKFLLWQKVAPRII